MKKGVFGKIQLFAFILFAISLVSVVSADTGPHTAARLEFYVTYNNSSIPGNFSAEILACWDENCSSDNYALCMQGICSFNYYRVERVPRNMILLVHLDNGNFTSGIINFLGGGDYFVYNVDINPENKVVVINPPLISDVKSSSLWAEFGIALALTIIIELIILIIFLRVWKVRVGKWKKPIITLLIVNIISVPIVWIIFFVLLMIFLAFSPLFGVMISIIIAELFAIAFEAFIIYWINKKIINLKRAFILSVVMNIISFILGGIILAVLLSLP